MLFLSPWMLWALLAASIPVLVHLINRWRHKSIQWAAIDFIIKSTKQRRGRKKIYHYVILLLRTIAVAALVLAVARPLSSSFIGWSGSGIREVILIIDRSSSMGAKPDQNESLQEMVPGMIENVVSALGNPRLVLIDSITGSPIHISSPSTLSDLSISKTTDTSSDFSWLLSKAADYLGTSNQGHTEIWVVSDMQAGDWQLHSSKWKSVKAALLSLPSPPDVRFLSLRQRPDDNRSVRVEKAAIEKGQLVIDFSISSEGGFANIRENLPVTISIDHSSSVIHVPVLGEKSLHTRKFPLPNGKESGFGYISLPHDARTNDDQYFFVYARTGQANIGVHTQDAKSGTIIRNMSAPPGISNRRATALEQEPLPSLNEFSFIVWQDDLPEGEMAVLMERYVEQGGIVLFLPPSSPRVTEKTFLGVSWGALQEAEKDEFFTINTWNRTRGALRDASGNQPVPVDYVQAIQKRLLQGEHEQIAQWNDESSALGKIAFGKGSAYFLTSLPDYSWSNLEEGHLLLPLLQRLTDDGVQRFSQVSSFNTGSKDIPSSINSIPERIDDFETALWQDKQYSPQTTAGVYSLESTIFAVNRPYEEDLPEQLEDDQLKVLFSGLNISNFNTEESDTLAEEIWRLFFILCILFLITEALLSMPPSETKAHR